MFTKTIACKSLAVSAVLAFGVSRGQADVACKILDQDTFSGDGHKVVLAKNPALSTSAIFLLFKAPLAVNTDGAPTSYNPDDFLGESIAINRIDNGIAIRRKDRVKMSTNEKRAIFSKWRSSDWLIPAGYTINWKKVIAEDSSGKPCVFVHGPYKGYFGSLTALKNGLSNEAHGECQSKNQIDERVIPAIVLRGSRNDPLQRFGAKVGDLVLAVNPVTKTAIAAVVGDQGDGNRIGEGSVALNMSLLGIQSQPKNYNDAKKLDTGNKAEVVAIFPSTSNFKLERPYTAENLQARVEAWAEAYKYGRLDALISTVLACSKRI